MWVGGFHKFQSFALQNNVFFSFLFFGGGLPLEENSKTINIWSLSSFVFFTALSKILVIVTIICCFHTLFEKTDEDAECDAATSQGFSQLVPSFLFFCSHEKLFCQRRSYFIGTIKLCQYYQTHQDPSDSQVPKDPQGHQSHHAVQLAM